MKLNNFLLSKTKILSREFYQRDTVTVAKDLIGKVLVRKISNQVIAGIITETEAYKSCDPASHCYYKIGETKRNAAMFGPVGHAYVYISYGIHFCFNIVAKDPRVYKSGGVLIRSVVPILGLEFIKKFRNCNSKNIKLENLTNGPGKVTQAFKINLSFNHLDLTSFESSLFVVTDSEIESQINKDNILETPRIGISKAVDKPWRFVLEF